MIRTLLSKYSNDHLFSIGTFIRIYGVNDGAAKKIEEDYYEYMIATIPGDSKYKLITNVSREVTSGKAGYALSLVATTNNSIWVRAEELKKLFNFDEVYIIEY